MVAIWKWGCSNCIVLFPHSLTIVCHRIHKFISLNSTFVNLDYPTFPLLNPCSSFEFTIANMYCSFYYYQSALKGWKNSTLLTFFKQCDCALKRVTSCNNLIHGRWMWIMHPAFKFKPTFLHTKFKSLFASLASQLTYIWANRNIFILNTIWNNTEFRAETRNIFFLPAPFFLS